MAKWHVHARVVGSKYLGKFEAETAETAIDLANESDEVHVSLCHHCSAQCENAELDQFTAEPE